MCCQYAVIIQDITILYTMQLPVTAVVTQNKTREIRGNKLIFERILFYCFWNDKTLLCLLLFFLSLAHYLCQGGYVFAWVCLFVR